MPKSFLLLCVAALGFLTPTASLAQGEKPRCRWRLAVAVPDEGNTMIAFNGATVAVNGYPGGFGSGGISAGAGSMRLELSHPVLGEVKKTIQLKANAMNTIIAHVVEEEVEEKVIRSLEVVNYATAADGDGKPQIHFLSLSKALSIEVKIDNSPIRIPGKQTKAIPLKSNGTKDIMVGEEAGEVELIAGEASPVVVLYDSIDGKPKMAASF